MNVDLMCPVTTHAALERAAMIGPDVEAVVSDGKRVTYSQMAARVSQIRSAMHANGISRGQHVALCLGNGPEWVALFLAATSLGAVVVPINTRFRAAEIAFVLNQSKCTVLFTVDKFLRVDFIEMLREIHPAIDGKPQDQSLPSLSTVVVLGSDVPPGALSFEDYLAAGAGQNTAPTAQPGDAALIQYTSGTTSFPKGVLLTHRSLCADSFVSGGRMGLRVADRFHSARPFFHVAGSSLSVLSCIQHVSTLVTMPRFEPGLALELFEQERCTHFSGNDTIALMLLNHPDRPKRKMHLRGAWVAASPTIVRRVIDELGAVEAVVGYGLSEASPNVAQSCWWEDVETRVSGRMLPEPGVEIKIVKASSDATAADAAAGSGVVGEIFVRGWNVMQGYYDLPKETAAALDASGWLRTGDLGCVDETGRLTFVGRAKEIIRVGGENVAPSEVEDILHRHPQIRLAIVVGVPDERLIEVPFAFVQLRSGESATSEAIREWAKQNMAGFKVPHYVDIVENFESIGMTASSKVQKSSAADHARKIIAEGAK